MQQEILHRIKNFCRNYNIIEKGDKILVGLSGGADSVFLLYALCELREEWNLTIGALHVNHGIRGREAERDTQFCRELATGWQIPLEVYYENIPEIAKEHGWSEEEAGRIIRYERMEQCRAQQGYDKIAVAHHMDDQAETVLFQMLRGSSLRGMGAMHPVRQHIIRPLLCVRRGQIVEQLQQNGICWCEDSTNQETVYARNKIRHQILPALEEQVSRQSVEHLAQMTFQMQEVFDYIQSETERIKNEIVRYDAQGISVSAKAFGRLQAALQKELTMQLLEEVAGCRKDLTGRHVEDFCALVQGTTGKRIDLPYAMQAGKDYDVVWLHRKERQERLPAHRISQTKPVMPEDEADIKILQSGTVESGQRADIKISQSDTVEPEQRADYEMSQPGTVGAGQGADSPMLQPIPVMPDASQTFSCELTASDGAKMQITLQWQQKNPFAEAREMSAVKNSCTKWFDYARIDTMLKFRYPQDGDYFLIQTDGKRKKLSRFFMDQKIPVGHRKRIWVLAMGHHILWIPELNRTSAGFYINRDTKAVLHATCERSDGLQNL